MEPRGNVFHCSIEETFDCNSNHVPHFKGEILNSPERMEFRKRLWQRSTSCRAAVFNVYDYR